MEGILETLVSSSYVCFGLKFQVLLLVYGLQLTGIDREGLEIWSPSFQSLQYCHWAVQYKY